MYNSEGYLVQYYLDTTRPKCYERKVNLSNDNVTNTDITIESWNIIYSDDSISGGNTYPASRVSYDGTESGLDSDNAQDAIDEVVANFQDGVDSIYDACVAKGSTPASKSLSDVVQGIEDIETGITPTGTISITSNGTKDVTNYASANVNVPNSNSGTYTPTTRATSIDMGATNSYRYVTTTSVPNSNSTTYTATTRATKIDLGSTNTYRYLVTSDVPNSNSTTYTYGSGSTGATVNMGATNTYRYVNAANVYAKGKKDLSITKKYRFICDTTNKWGVVLMFTVTVSNGAVTVTPRPTSSPYDYALSINADLYTGWANFRTSDAVTYKVEETSW